MLSTFLFRFLKTLTLQKSATHKLYLMSGRILLICIVLIPWRAPAQDSLTFYERAFHFPNKFFSGIDRKSQKFQEKLNAATLRYLNKLKKKELRLQRRMQATDSIAASQLFGHVKARYAKLREHARHPLSQMPTAYNGHLDSLKTTLKFLDANQALGKAGIKLPGTLDHLKKVQSGINASEYIRQQMLQRQQMIASFTILSPGNG
jgi:hypothetical protein